MSLNRDIEIRVQSFIAEVTELVRRQALTAVAEALGGGNGVPGLRRGPGRPPKSFSSSSSVARRGRGGKRSPDELEALARTLTEYVKSHPGMRIEQIGKSLGQSTKELAGPMKKLVESRRVKTTGNRRATKYFVADGAARGRPAKKR